jgi:hypothetical protein
MSPEVSTVESDRGRRAEEVLATAARTGSVDLPTLTRYELAALGALDQGAWRDGDDVAWWQGLDGETREAVTIAALRGMGARGLVDLAGEPVGEDEDRVPVATGPELACVLVARSNPSFLVIGRESVTGTRGRAWLYGISEAGAGLRGVLSERVDDNGLHRFRLGSPDRAVGDFAAWACSPATVVRTIQAVLPEGSRPPQHRFVVAVQDHEAQLIDVSEDDRHADPRPVTPAELTDRLLDVVGAPWGPPL